jgi:hypothetical protein
VWDLSPPIHRLSPLELHRIAFQAQTVMTTDHPAALLTLPFLLLVLQKRRHPFTLDHFQVGDHAHVILTAIAHIEVLHPRTREQLTLKAKYSSLALQARAVFYPTTNTTRIFLFTIH